MKNDILMSSRDRQAPEEIYRSKSQVVIQGAFEDIHLPSPEVDCFIFDTPGIEDGTSLREYQKWLQTVFDRIDALAARDCALILFPRDRKGGAFLKSLVTAEFAQERGWNIFRHFCWDKGSDFHRARYMHQSIFVFRRGDMPTRLDSSVRFKDIIRLRDLPDPDEGSLAELPVEIPQMLISLFDSRVVMDPFAGSGSVAEACHNLGVEMCFSVELDPQRASSIKARLESLDVE